MRTLSKQDTFFHPKYIPLLHPFQPLKQGHLTLSSASLVAGLERIHSIYTCLNCVLCCVQNSCFMDHIRCFNSCTSLSFNKKPHTQRIAQCDSERGLTASLAGSLSLSGLMLDTGSGGPTISVVLMLSSEPPNTDPLLAAVLKFTHIYWDGTIRLCHIRGTSWRTMPLQGPPTKQWGLTHALL